MNDNKIRHLIYLLNDIPDIPQKDIYFKKLLREKIDNIIYKLNVFHRCDLNGVE